MISPANPKKEAGKETSGMKNKKQPQRGMGVAQLERLRIQERWRKMTTETIAVPAPQFHDPSLIPKFTHFSPEFRSSPLRVINGGYGCLPASYWSQSIRAAMPGHFSIDNSGEVASLTKIPRYIMDDCGVSLKKTRVIEGGAYEEPSPMNGGYDFLGLNLGDNHRHPETAMEKPLDDGRFCVEHAFIPAAVKDLIGEGDRTERIQNMEILDSVDLSLKL